MPVCLSCHPTDPPHTEADHYHGTLRCSLCDCAAFTAPPEPPPEPAGLTEAVAIETAPLREAIVVGEARVDTLASRVLVLERELRELQALVSQPQPGA